MDEKKEQLENLKTRIEGIGISRLPINTKLEFKELARVEFCDDYGMTLKWLIDQAKLTAVYDMLAAKVLELDNRVSGLESTPAETKEPKTRKLLDGRKIKVKEEEKK